MKDGFPGPQFYWRFSSELLKQRVESRTVALAQIKFLRTRDQLNSRFYVDSVVSNSSTVAVEVN